MSIRFFVFGMFSLLLKKSVGYVGCGGCVRSSLMRNFHTTTVLYKKKQSVRNYDEEYDNFCDVGGGCGGGGGGGGVQCGSSGLDARHSPKTKNQDIYMKHLLNPDVDVVLGIGPAGSGKTMLAVCAAIQLLKNGAIEKIVITRPLVPVDEENLGFLPGNLNNKMQPWTQPIMDIFADFYTPVEIKRLIAGGVIEMSPLAFMRGRTFKKSVVIADEMQNSSPNQMLMMNTRIGDECKLVVTGDLKQTDRMENNGLADFVVKYKKYRDVHGLNVTADNVQIVELTGGDILRSAIVRKIIDVYGGNGGDGQPQQPQEKLVVSEVVVNRVFNDTVITNGKGTDDAALIPRNDVLKLGGRFHHGYGDVLLNQTNDDFRYNYECVMDDMKGV